MEFSDIKFNRIKTRNLNVELRDFKSTIEKYTNYDEKFLYADFQRDLVWDKKRKVEFIELMLQGGIIQPFFINSNINHTLLVDGRNRTFAILEFLNNELAIFDNVYFKDIKNFKFGNYTFDFMIADIDNINSIIDWYVLLNSASVAHTKSDIDKALNFKI